MYEVDEAELLFWSIGRDAQDRRDKRNTAYTDGLCGIALVGRT